MNKKISFTIIGIVSVVLGVICFSFNVGNRVEHNSYGGDAYTGIQNAVATTANNLEKLLEVAKFGFGFLLIIIGLILIAIATAKGSANMHPAAISGPVNSTPQYMEYTSSTSPKTAEEIKSPQQLLDRSIISQQTFDLVTKDSDV